MARTINHPRPITGTPLTLMSSPVSQPTRAQVLSKPRAFARASCSPAADGAVSLCLGGHEESQRAGRVRIGTAIPISKSIAIGQVCGQRTARVSTTRGRALLHRAFAIRDQGAPSIRTTTVPPVIAASGDGAIPTLCRGPRPNDGLLLTSGPTISMARSIGRSARNRSWALCVTGRADTMLRYPL